jgi:hypothetical protein
MPSSLRDHTRKRERAARKAFSGAWGCKLRARGLLVCYTINLHDVPALADLADDARNLYLARSLARIRAFTDGVFGKVPHRVKVEFHPDFGLHIHVIAQVLGREQVGCKHHRTAVSDLFGQLGYLSKPGDARATKTKPHHRAWSDSEKLEAKRLYNDARAKLWKRKGKTAKLPQIAWFQRGRKR